MHLNVLSRAATKQRTCALSDTLSARVLLAEQALPCSTFRFVMARSRFTTLRTPRQQLFRPDQRKLTVTS